MRRSTGDSCGPRRGRFALPRLVLGDQFADRTGLAPLRVEPGVEDLQEDPLCPAVVVRVGGGERPALVVRQAQLAQLGAVPLDVGLGGRPRVGAGLHRVLLGGQPERVEAHRVQHVEPGLALVPGVAVGADVAQRVADVQTGAGRVGEHVLHVQFRRAGPRMGRGRPARPPGWGRGRCRAATNTAASAARSRSPSSRCTGTAVSRTRSSSPSRSKSMGLGAQKSPSRRRGRRAGQTLGLRLSTAE